MTDQTKEITSTADLLPAEYVSDIPKLVKAMQESLVKAQDRVASFPDVTSDEQKAEAFTLREKIRLAMEDYKGRRMPFTRALNGIVSVFTKAENGYEALLDIIDGKTKKYATKQLEDARVAKMESDKKLREEQARIELIASIKVGLEQRVATYLDTVRGAAGKVVAAVTKETLAADKVRLQVEPKWTEKMELGYFTMPTHLTTDDQQTTFAAIAAEEYPRLKQYYSDRGKQILVDTISLLEVAVTNKAEANRLNESLVAEQKQKEEAVQTELITNADADKAFASMDHAAAPPPAVKIKMKIEVSSNDGWLQLLAFWYSNDPEARTTDLSKTLSKFKTFAEKKVNFDNTRIHHPAITYVEDVSAKK